MTGKIFRSIMAVAAVVLLCSLGVIMGVLCDYYDGAQMTQMKNELMLAATGTELNGLDYLEQVESNRLRLTWISPEGDYYDGAQMTQMKNELMLAATGTELNGLDYLEQVESNRLRLTWISPEGRVIFDSKADAESMENHANREEFREALTYGTGSGVAAVCATLRP